MMNTVRVELTQSISPELNWKIAKGYRSAPRRRKPVDQYQKLCVEPENKSTRSSSETTVSESEKLGVAVLGRRFSDKIEHVPIKKRRFMVRSPSPPSRSSSQLLDQRASGHNSIPKPNAKKHTIRRDTSLATSFGKKRLTERTNEKLCYGEDFSGIEILAAAACNNSINDDISEELSRMGTNASNSATPLEKTVASTCSATMVTDSEISEGRDASMGTIHYSPKDVVHEEKVEKSSLEASQVKTSSGGLDDPAVESSKDVKFHWDLNVCMDAWEQPSDSVMVEPQADGVENVSLDNRQSAKQLVSEVGDAQETVKGKNGGAANVEQGLKTSPVSEMSAGKFGITDNALGCAKDDGVVSNNTFQIADHSSVGLVNLTGQATVSLENNGLPLSSFGVPPERIQVDKPGKALVPVAEGVSCEMESTVVDDDCKGSGATSSFHDDPKSPEEMTGIESCHVPALLEVKPVGKKEDLTKSASGVSVGESPSLVTLMAKDQVEVTDTVNAQQNAGFLDVTAKSTVNATMDPAVEAGSSCHEQSPTENHKIHTVAKENHIEPEPGYDSQYEDGELRETDAPYWEENEFEEVERVDYGSDTCDTDAADGSISEKVGLGLECKETEISGIESRKINMNLQAMRGSSLGSDNICGKVEQFAVGQALRQSSVGSKTRTSGSDQLPGDSEASSNRIAEATEGCTIRKHTDGKAPIKVDGSFDSLHRIGTACARRRYDTFNFSTRSEEAGSDYSIGKERRTDSRLLDKSLGSGRLVHPSRSYWDSKRRGSPPYPNSFGSGRPRPRSGIDSDGYVMDPDDTFSEATEIAGVHNRVRRPAMNYSSNRSYQPTFRRRSPDTHRGMMPMRDTSPDRRRFGRYQQGVGRGFRECHRPIPDDINDSSYNGPRRMARREPSTSPPARAPIYYSRPYKKFQSRGRSRSPLAWERNEVSRHRGSRSPDYRFDAKMEKGRLPFQKNSFGAKYEPGFFSPPKRRFSPQRNSRWFDDQNGSGDHNFRGTRGGGRRFQPNPRFDSVRSRRLNSDDYFEPMVRPARFSELNSGRECRFEGSDEDRRKHDGRFEVIRRVRRYDPDVNVRQFRYEEEDRYVPRNTQNFEDCDNRGAERRPQNSNTQNFEDRDNRGADRRPQNCNPQNFEDRDNRSTDRRHQNCNTQNFEDCDDRGADRLPRDGFVAEEQQQLVNQMAD